jgi:hypothetical protein
VPLNNTPNPATIPAPIASPRIVFLLIIWVFISISFPLFDVVFPVVCRLGSNNRLIVVFISSSYLPFRWGFPFFLVSLGTSRLLFGTTSQ